MATPIEVTDPDLLRQLGPPPSAATSSPVEVTDPNLLQQLGPPPLPRPQGWDAVAANAATGFTRGVGNFVGLPQAIGAAMTTPKAAGSSWVPDAGELAAKYLPSPEGVSNFIFNQTGAQPYQPETPLGKIGQSALSNVVPSLFSGGVAGAGSRLAAGMAGGAGGQAVANVAPDNYYAQLAASLAAALGGGLTAQGARGVGSQVGNMINPYPAAERTVGREVAASPPTPAWPGGPMVSGNLAPVPSGGGVSDLIAGLTGPALGFAGEHLLGGMSGGVGGAVIGGKIGEALHSFASKRAADALESVRQRAQSDPAFAAQLMQQFNSSPGWAAYLAQRTPWAAAPLPGGPTQ